MVIVRKKHTTMRRAIVIRKIKFAGVSKPSQLEKAARGAGKMAMHKKTIGNKSQAMELLMEMVFFLRAMAMMIKSVILAIAISS